MPEGYYKVNLDKERFEEQFVGGENGYYDKAEKIFIPKRIVKLLRIEEISPRNNPKHSIDTERIFFEKSRKRVSLNSLDFQFCPNTL